MIQVWEFEDGSTTEATGWTGRVLEFRPDGTEIVHYDDATPVTGEGPEGKAVNTWRGTATYDVATQGTSLNFESVDFSDTTVTSEYAGETSSGRPEGGSEAVTYTCDETTHTQKNDKYEATFTRLPEP